MISKLAVFGDSILKGIVLDKESGRYTLLGKKCCVSSVSDTLGLPIENFCKFGQTSEKGREVLERKVEKMKDCDAVVFCFGGNDVDHDWLAVSNDPDGENPPHTRLSRFYENMKAMLGTVAQNGIVPILITLPPIHSKRYFNWFSKDFEKPQNVLHWLGDVETIYRHHAEYSSCLSLLAKETDTRIIDMREAFLGEKSYGDYLCLDGIHPNEKGHVLMEHVFLEYARKNLA